MDFALHCLNRRPAYSEVEFFLQSQNLSKKRIRGFEFLSTIPGTIGGSVFMNAGCFGMEIKNLIKESMPDAEITIKDLAGDENHYSATIKSKIFAGKSKIEQHKLVYKALKGKMGNELHALALNTMEI